jgi:hypothetical protein
MKLITTSVFVFGIFVQNIFGQSMTFNPGKHSTTWMQKQQIIFQYASDSGQFNPEWKAGDNWLFEHRYSAPEYAEVADDEVSETFVWQIKPTTNKKIVLTGKDLIAANAYFLKSCFCLDRGYHKVTDGKITMIRMSNGFWKVDFEFELEAKNGAQPIKVKRTSVLFKLNN